MLRIIGTKSLCRYEHVELPCTNVEPEWEWSSLTNKKKGGDREQVAGSAGSFCGKKESWSARIGVFGLPLITRSSASLLPPGSWDAIRNTTSTLTRPGGFGLLGGLQPRQDQHVDVHQYQVRLIFADQLNRFRSIGRLPDSKSHKLKKGQQDLIPGGWMPVCQRMIRISSLYKLCPCRAVIQKEFVSLDRVEKCLNFPISSSLIQK